MKLHVVYRSVGSENKKNRPPFYDKTLALASLLRAVKRSRASTDLVFVNDGAIPPERLNLMLPVGEVVQVRCGSNRASLRRALTLPRERGWGPGDLVWFAEDDYLYKLDAFAAFVTAASSLSHADYFALYNSWRFDLDTARLSPNLRREVAGNRSGATVGNSHWCRTVSTTSTFGVRVRTLLADQWLLRAVPFVGGAFDHATCLTLQGYRPFGLDELGGAPLDPREASVAKRVARTAALTACRLAVDALASARPSRARRILVVSEPELATHLEVGRLAHDTDWAAVTSVVADWLRGYQADGRP